MLVEVSVLLTVRIPSLLKKHINTYRLCAHEQGTQVSGCFVVEGSDLLVQESEAEWC